MNEPIKSFVCQGGCHCGEVRFQVLVDRDIVYDCNCSICRKKGFLHLIVPPENFTLLRDKSSLISYTFNTRIANHTFCSVCGIHCFYRPRSHPDKIDVNVRTLDLDSIGIFKIKAFDGQNWENNVDKIQN